MFACETYRISNNAFNLVATMCNTKLQIELFAAGGKCLRNESTSCRNFVRYYYFIIVFFIPDEAHVFHATNKKIYIYRTYKNEQYKDNNEQYKEKEAQPEK